MHIIYGIIIATLAIIAAEIKFDYSLGDLVKDFFIRIFHGAAGVALSVEQRAEARLAWARNEAVKVAAQLKARV